MPVTRIPLAPESPIHLKLVQDLVSELRQDTPTGPKIIEEEQHGGYMHITVIWDAWNDVDPEERGRIIMDAYGKQRPSDVPKITVALGLTQEEARRLGIKA